MMNEECVKVFKNGNIHVRLSEGTMESIKWYKSDHDLRSGYENMLCAAKYDLDMTLEYNAEAYCYGRDQLCCMTWSTCDYHTLFYCYRTDMVYDFSDYDIYHTLCEGKVLKLKGRKPYDEEDRKDIMRWLAQEQGWEDEYDDEEDDDESEAV